MDGQNAPQPSFELPAPVKAVETGVPSGGEVQMPKPEQGPAIQEVAPQAGNSASQGQAPPVPIIPPVLVNDPAVATTTGHPVATPGAPAIAGDVDVIEKEWVHKAKEIVNKTREDPYLQNQQLTAYKADYIQKRYNKQVKVADDQRS